MRIFKKRILMFDLMGCSGGTKTFLENWFPLIDEFDIVVDIINFSPANKAGLNKMKDSFDNIGVIFQAAEIVPELYKENTIFKNELVFFGSLVKNNIFEYIQQKLFYHALHKNMYDFVFINHSECITSVLNTMNFSSILKTFIYSHCSHTFTSHNLFKGRYTDIASQYIIDSINNHGNVDIITQKKNNYITETFKTNSLVIGMPLNVKKIFSYHHNNVREDKILYLGRAYNGAKNIKGFIDVVSKTNYKACFIVPEAKDREKINEMCNDVNFNNFEVYCKLSEEEKYQISATCKVCYVSSITETFNYVVYENLNLMNVVVDRHVWSEELKESLPDIYLTNIENAVETLDLAISEFNYEKIVKQHEMLLAYNEEIKNKWCEYLLSTNLNTFSEKKETKHAKLLSEKHTLDSIFKYEKKMDFTQFFTLYKNIDWKKIIQTKEITLYNIDFMHVEDFLNNNALDSNVLF